MVWLVIIIVLVMACFYKREITGGSPYKFEWLLKTNWFETEPLVKIEDLKPVEGFKYPLDLSNCHLGQRKLLLNEILFYTKYLPKGPSTIIYSGSAHGEHTPIILEMFPDCRIIMVDPNFHIMDYDYKYVYKAAKGNKKDILKSATQKGGRGKNLLSLIEALKTKKCVDGSIHNALEEDNFGTSDNIKLIDNSSRVFVIQDYMTRDLAKKLKGDIYISDIRTSLVEEGNPTAIDIIYNSALQLNIFHELNIPCHLKFVLPQFRKVDKSLDRIDEFPFVKEELDFSKSYGIDFLDNHKNAIFEYYDGDIYLQPWAPPSSRECRLVITKPKKKIYNRIDYCMRFNYFVYMRQNAFVKSNVFVKDYDGCVDCALEQYIINKYIKGNPGKDLSYYYDLITQYTYWDLKSIKCPSHSFFTKPKKMAIFKYEDDYKAHSIKVKRVAGKNVLVDFNMLNTNESAS